jgi:putative ABC transport system permease protein
MQFRAGRGFSEDHMRGEASVVVVNEAFVRRFIRCHDPIGEEIGREPRPDVKGEWFQIVGVVADARAWGAKYASLPSVYFPMSEKQRELTPTLLVRTTGDPVSLASNISTVVRSIESEAPLTRIGSLDQLYAENVAVPRFRTLVFSIFGGLGLALALVGNYAAIAHSVTQRTREIGVRMALGAQKRDLLWLILRESMVFTSVGIILGIVGAFALTRFLQSFLYEVKPTDFVTFVAVALLMLLAGLAASYFPTRRALRVDPVVILRYD